MTYESQEIKESAFKNKRGPREKLGSGAQDGGIPSENPCRERTRKHRPPVTRRNGTVASTRQGSQLVKHAVRGGGSGNGLEYSV